MNEILERRTNFVIESLMENEALMEDLQTEDASALLDWGIACAREIVNDTSEYLDDEAAEEVMYPRLRALRKMMRQINLLLSGRAGSGLIERATCINEILAQAETVYGAAFTPLSMEQRTSLLSVLGKQPETWIATLRAMLEPSAPAEPEEKATEPAPEEPKPELDP